jgi:hypothetical protein
MPKIQRQWFPRIAVAAVAGALLAAPATAQTDQQELEKLKQEIQELRRRDEENRRKLEALEEKLHTLDARPEEKESAAAALDRALEEAAEETDDAGRSPDLWSRRAGQANLRLIDVSMDVMAAAGTSTADDDELEDLQAGEHDPNQRGFTLQQGELSLLAAVDPYLTAESHVIFTPDGIELEEAFFTTQSLPYGLQFEGGHFFTEFGRVNPAHAHAWDWLDQPVINSRLFGGDGNRSPGFRLGWLTPLPWFSEVHFGMQNADEGGFTPSFMGRSVGGRPTVDRDVESLEDLLYLMRWNNSWEVSDLDLRRRFQGPLAPGKELPWLAFRRLANRSDEARLSRRLVLRGARRRRRSARRDGRKRPESARLRG